MTDILHAARTEVVHDQHIVSSREKGLGKMRTDKSRSTCDQNSNCVSPAASPTRRRDCVEF